MADSGRSVAHVEQDISQEHNIRVGDVEEEQRAAAELDPSAYGEVAALLHGAQALVEADQEWSRPARAAVREASEMRLAPAIASVVDLLLEQASVQVRRAKNGPREPRLVALATLRKALEQLARAGLE